MNDNSKKCTASAEMRQLYGYKTVFSSVNRPCEVFATRMITTVNIINAIKIVQSHG